MGRAKSLQVLREEEAFLDGFILQQEEALYSLRNRKDSVAKQILLILQDGPTPTKSPSPPKRLSIHDRGAREPHTIEHPTATITPSRVEQVIPPLSMQSQHQFLASPVVIELHPPPTQFSVPLPSHTTPSSTQTHSEDLNPQPISPRSRPPVPSRANRPLSIPPMPPSAPKPIRPPRNGVTPLTPPPPTTTFQPPPLSPRATTTQSQPATPSTPTTTTTPSSQHRTPLGNLIARFQKSDPAAASPSSTRFFHRQGDKEKESVVVGGGRKFLSVRRKEEKNKEKEKGKEKEEEEKEKEATTTTTDSPTKAVYSLWRQRESEEVDGGTPSASPTRDHLPTRKSALILNMIGMWENASPSSSTSSTNTVLSEVHPLNYYVALTYICASQHSLKTPTHTNTTLTLPSLNRNQQHSTHNAHVQRWHKTHKSLSRFSTHAVTTLTHQSPCSARTKGSHATPTRTRMRFYTHPRSHTFPKFSSGLLDLYG